MSAMASAELSVRCQMLRALHIVLAQNSRRFSSPRSAQDVVRFGAAESGVDGPAGVDALDCVGVFAHAVTIAAGVRASWRMASSRRRLSCWVVVSCASSRSHNAINSSTLATMRCCSARGGKAMGMLFIFA